jgi:sugar lactone lactonase YvrE
MIMRFVPVLLVSFLITLCVSGEKAATAALPRSLEDNLPLYVCSYPGGGQGRLFKFDSQTGEKLAELSGAASPRDVAINQSGEIFATDNASGESNVRRFDPDTGQADATPYGQTSQKLGGPTGLTFGPDDHLYVADYRGSSGKVVEFDETGTWVRDLPDNPVDPVLTAIEDVACDGDGRIYVTQWDDGSGLTPGVYRFTGTGWVLFGQTNELVGAWGLAFGPDGDLYVAESSFDASGIYRYDGASGFSKGVYGDTGSVQKLVQPRYLTFGPDGDLYVTDQLDSTIRTFSGPGKPDEGDFMEVFATTSPSDLGPFGLVFGVPGETPLKPQLVIEPLPDGLMLLTLTGTQGQSYELKYTSDPTVPDFTQWTFGAIISLEGVTSDSWTDDTAPASPLRFYKAQQQ